MLEWSRERARAYTAWRERRDAERNYREDAPKSILIEYSLILATIATGLAILFFSSVIEHNLDLLGGIESALRTGKVPVPPAPVKHPANDTAMFFLLLKELGVAFLVAGLVGFSVEKKARDRDNARARRLRADVATNAIYALYGLSHQSDFIKAIVETNLEAKTVREDTHLQYTLRALKEEEADQISPGRPQDALQRFVMLEMVTKFTVRNVSAFEQRLKIEYMMSRRAGEGARPLTRVETVHIGRRRLSPRQIAKGNLSKRGDGDIFYRWNRRLPRGETVAILIGALCLKERSDNEVWSSFFPTMGDMTLTLTVLKDMSFDVRPITSAAMIEELHIPSPVSKTWRLDGPLLRHNSLVFWWRTPEDDALATRSAPISFTPATAEVLAIDPTMLPGGAGD